MLLERRCAGCGRAGRSPCPVCIGQLRAPTAGAGPVGLAWCCSLFDYDDQGRALVVALKYRNRRDVAAALGVGMAALVDRHDVDLVTWAPTSAARRAARGYDQSRLLAVAVARALGRPRAGLLRRSRDRPQTGRPSAERRQGPTFTVRGRPSGRVLLIDDVVTTGATLSAAGRALRAAGATSVIGLTAACTPLKLPGAAVDNQGGQESRSHTPTR
jgi:ComF family protein